MHNVVLTMENTLNSNNKITLSVYSSIQAYLFLNKRQGTYVSHFFRIVNFDGLLGCHLEYWRYLVFYRGGRHCIFMLQTKTNTNAMVYRINNKLDFRAYFVTKICTFPVFKHEYYI